ncbi:mCG19286, isoform CRA_c, partial [Mus musculus]
VKHGEFGIRRVLPGATAACSLGTETCLHRSGAAGDRATLPGTTGAGGHVLPADPESQRNTTTTRTPDPVWDLGAHLCRQPVSGRIAGRGSVKPSQKGQVHLPTFSPVGLAQCLNLPASPAVKWDNSTTCEAGLMEVYEGV